jgi:hypothetical protein
MAVAPFPLQQPVTIIALTTSGYLSGTVHLLAMKNLRTLLNAQDEILKLTDAVLPGSQLVQPFLALRKGSALLIVPKADSELLKPEPSAWQKARRLVTCLMDLGCIRGYIEVPENIRTSDFLLRSPGFLEFRECFLGPNSHLDSAEMTGQPLPLVYVNSRRMVGVTEEAQAPD